MIKPHGADALMPLYVQGDNTRQQLITDSQNLKSVLLSSAGAANAVMLGGGYFYASDRVYE